MIDLDDDDIRTIILALSAMLESDSFWRYHERSEALLYILLEELDTPVEEE